MRVSTPMRVIALVFGGIVAGITNGCTIFGDVCTTVGDIESTYSTDLGLDDDTIVCQVAWGDCTCISLSEECDGTMFVGDNAYECIEAWVEGSVDDTATADTGVDTGGDTSGDTGTDTADTGDTAEVEDADGDGYDVDSDCDDTDASLNLDDGDGDGYTTCDDDCDDTDATVYPGADEVCDDLIDNDCDGDVDEECEEECADDLGEELSWLCVDAGTISMAYDELTWDQADDYAGTWSDPDMSEIAISGIGIGDGDWSYDADYLVDYDSSTNWFSYDHDTIGWYRVNFRSEAAWAYFADLCESSTETSALCYKDTSGRWSFMYYFDGTEITY